MKSQGPISQRCRTGQQSTEQLSVSGFGWQQGWGGRVGGGKGILATSASNPKEGALKERRGALQQALALSLFSGREFQQGGRNGGHHSGFLSGLTRQSPGNCCLPPKWSYQKATKVQELRKYGFVVLKEYQEENHLILKGALKQDTPFGTGASS